ncbi:MAG: hypothetical protein COA69_02685 [Robiginitomaculum sp.]|nr:MAG: hypothetical protein COA69_02685 [Robiginitomaculum sp.]
MEGIFAIIGIFGGIPLTIWIFLHHKFKVRAKSAELVNALINKDKDVTSELIRAIGFAPSRSHSDLRASLILGAIGTAMYIFGRAIPEEEAEVIFGGLASFPFLIGLALFAFWFFVSRKDEV